MIYIKLINKNLDFKQIVEINEIEIKDKQYFNKIFEIIGFDRKILRLTRRQIKHCVSNAIYSHKSKTYATAFYCDVVTGGLFSNPGLVSSLIKSFSGINVNSTNIIFSRNDDLVCGLKIMIHNFLISFNLFDIIKEKSKEMVNKI